MMGEKRKPLYEVKTLTQYGGTDFWIVKADTEEQAKEEIRSALPEFEVVNVWRV